MRSKKGQVSIEFMFIIMVSLIYMQLLVSTVIQPSIDAVEDTTRISQARLSAEKLSSSINELASSMGENVKTVHIYVPKDATFGCTTDNKIQFSVKLYGSEIAACGLTTPPQDTDLDGDSTKCTKAFPLNVSSGNFDCAFDIGNYDLNTMDKDKGLLRPVTIRKNADGKIRVE